MSNEIRKVTQQDIPALKQVLDSIELFPSEMLEDMMEDYLTNPRSQDIWLTYVEDNTPISIAYCAPEKLAEGTYNLYAIGILATIQGKGIGKKMMTYIEALLLEMKQRVLIVETSSDPNYASTRAFYRTCNYIHEATIRDFWQDGEDKVIFWKKLH